MTGNGGTTIAADARAAAAPGGIEDHLVPGLGAPVSELTTYRSLFVLDTPGHDETSLAALDKPLNPFDESLATPAHTPAVGVLTVHTQAWVQQGLALGNLLHSICLAPGEVTKVAVVDWQRRAAGTSTDASQQGESVTSDIDQTRAANEVQRAVAHEAQSGGSAAATVAATAQAGVAAGGLFGSVSASGSTSATSAMTAQFSLGSRDLGASSTSTLSQRTAEVSQALRSRRAAVVREVSEQESEHLSARVLVNYNRRHALNIEYFEVLQLYSVETTLTRWERCLFVPMEPVRFDEPATLARHRADLIEVLRARGRHDLADMLIRDDPKHREQLASRCTVLGDGIQAKLGEIQDHQRHIAFYRELVAVVDAYLSYAGIPAGQQYADAMKAAFDRLREANPTMPIDAQPSIDLSKSLLDGLSKRDAEITRLSAQVKAATAELDGLRAELAVQSVAITEHLMADQLAFSQELWMRLDAYRVYRALAGLKVDERPLAAQIDPHPVGVFGNFVAFRWGFAGDAEGTAARESFRTMFLHDGEAPSDATTIAVPTSGVFAEAVLGRGEAAETIDDTRLWRWNEAPIPILPPDIDKLSRDRAKGMDLATDDFASALAALRAAAPSDGSRLADILAAATNGTAFRDMGGLAQAVTLADKVAALTGSGASDAGKRAADIHGKVLDTFVQVLNSDVGKAAVAEFMLPGAGAAVLQANGGAKSPAKPSKPSPERSAKS